MELQEVIKTRRSIRKFSDQKLTDGLLEKIIEAANHAPSHCNTQGWKFVYIDQNELKEKIFKAGGSYVIKNSPYGILVTYDTSLSDNFEYQDWIQSSSAAMQNMLLTIHDLGLGGCWVCHLPNKSTLKKILNIPTNYSPVAYLAFGYPNQPTVAIPRKSKITEILAINEFPWPAEKISSTLKVKRLVRRIYFFLPSPIKTLINPLVDKFVKKFYN